MKEVSVKDLRQFGIVLAIILGVIGGIHFLKGHASAYPWFWGFGASALIMAVFIPRILKPIYIVFTKIAHAIGWFNTRVILILVYYAILTPIGILMKVFGRDALNRKIDKSAESYWIKRQTVIPVKESLEKQF
jgi:ABC-type glycerol-3-phosphate transport system permease component